MIHEAVAAVSGSMFIMQDFMSHPQPAEYVIRSLKRATVMCMFNKAQETSDQTMLPLSCEPCSDYVDSLGSRSKEKNGCVEDKRQ